MKNKVLTVFLAIALSFSMALAGCGTGTVTVTTDAADADETETEAEIKTVETTSAPEEDSYEYLTTQWGSEQMEGLAGLFGGSFDMEFEAGEASRDDVHTGITYDEDIIAGIVFNTTGVDFDTPGEYEEIYTIHFLQAPLAEWMDENDVDPADYPGMEYNADVMYIRATGVITITGDAADDEETDDADAEAMTDDEIDAALAAGDITEDEAADLRTANSSANSTNGAAGSTNSGNSGTSNSGSGTASNSGSGSSGSSGSNGSGSGSSGSGSSGSGSSGSGSSGSNGSSGSGGSSGSSGSSGSGSGSSGSGSSGSSGSSAAACDHNWVATYHEATGHYESVLVSEAWDEKVDTGDGIYQCNGCGFQTTNGKEIAGHTATEGCGYSVVPLYETIHHDAVYDQKWVEDSAAYTTYTCSKCGATK